MSAIYGFIFGIALLFIKNCHFLIHFFRLKVFSDLFQLSKQLIGIEYTAASDVKTGFFKRQSYPGIACPEKMILPSGQIKITIGFLKPAQLGCVR